MSILSDKRHRHIVPRWRDSLTASGSRDFNPLRKPSVSVAPSQHVPTDVLLQISEFKEAPSIGTAADSLGSAIAAGHGELARPAAEFILRHANQAPSLLMEVAVSVLDGKHRAFGLALSSDPKVEVARLRARLKLFPRSATMWADLARTQATLGEIDKAKRSMKVSLALAPDHRWVLRSANRLLLHAGEYREAHQLLANHPRTRQDPWLMAAEIASAQLRQVSPRFLVRGRELLRNPSLAPVHLSELAAAVATSELENGKRKGARRLLRAAMQDPTENALAQIEWADRKAGDDLPVGQKVIRMADAYEAKFWVKRHEGQILDAYKAAISWMDDEPFADSPVSAASHSAAMLDDYDAVLLHTKHGLARNPGSLLHRNNQIFAMLSSGDCTDEDLRMATHFLGERIQARDDDFIHSMANAGLLMYRLGRIEEGAELYRGAVSWAEKKAGPVIAAQAAAYHLREAVLAKAPWINETLDVARKNAASARDGAVDFLMRKMEDLARSPEKASSILGPKSARLYLPMASVDVARELNVSMTDEGPVLIVPAHLIR